MKRAILLLTLSMVFLSVLACTPKRASPGQTAVSLEDKAAGSGGTVPAQSAGGWEEKWNKIVAAGRKEGKVVLYSTIGVDARNAIGDAFNKKYGIQLEGVSGAGAQITQKLLFERKASLYLADVSIGGLIRILGDLKPAGALERLDPLMMLPEVKEPRFWYRGQLPWLDGENEHITLRMSLSVNTAFIINTAFVKPEEMRSVKDLLNPRWKGKIIMGDPSVASASATWFSFTVRSFGDDFMRQLVKQEPMVLRDERLMAEWVAKGKYPVGLGIKNEHVYEMIKAGAPVVKYAPLETYLTSSGSCISLINKAAHPDAAVVFINWLLSREGQTVYSKVMEEQSAREDVSPDFLEPSGRRQPGVEYAQDSVELALFRVEHLELAKEIFKPLIAR